MHAEPEPAAALGRPVEAEHPAHRGVQAVGRDEVAGRLVVDEDVAAAVLDLADRALHDLHAGVGHGVGERPVQRGAADPAAVAVAERRVRGAATAEVADPGQPVTGRVHAERGQVGDGAGHQPLAAGLVDRAGPRLADLDVEAGAGGVQRGGQPDRAAAGDRRGHAPDGLRGSVARAAFSTRIRTVSRPALRTVKTTAVIQHACTSGSAIPSSTTAT